MNEMKIKFETKLNEMKLDIQTKLDEMIKDNRADEAKAEKAKINIIEIFEKMFKISLSKAIQSTEGDKLKVLEKHFLGFIDKIPINWYQRLEDAKEYKDYDVIFIEEAKIKMKDEIKNCFTEIVGEKDD